MKLLFHVEQYDVVGILPSQVESIGYLCDGMGITDIAYIDNTLDGFVADKRFKRYASLDEFIAAEDPPFVAFCPHKGKDIRNLEVPYDAWLLFGASMGFNGDSFNVDVTWASIPIGVLNSRDALPIAVWELGKWLVL